MGCTPFLTLTVQKIHCFFGPQKWPRKNRRELRTEKNCFTQFLLAHLLLTKKGPIRLKKRGSVHFQLSYLFSYLT